MKIAGHAASPFSVERVWDALLDPQVLVATIPGCSRLVATGEHSYDMTVTAGVAAIRGTYDGTCVLSDLVPHESLTMRLSGSGAPGTVDATVAVRFVGDGDVTYVEYDADAVVGGMVGGVGQRMLSSVSKRMAGEFFDNVGEHLSDRQVQGADAEPAPDWTMAWPDAGPAGQVYEAPAVVRPAHARADFLSGVAVGAGLVLLGVVAGGWRARRR